MKAIGRLALLACPILVSIAGVFLADIASAKVIVGSGERKFVIRESFPVAAAKLQTTPDGPAPAPTSPDRRRDRDRSRRVSLAQVAEMCPRCCRFVHDRAYSIRVFRP